MKKNVSKLFAILTILSLFAVSIYHRDLVQAADHTRKDEKQYVVVDVERFTIGEGYFIEPTLVEYQEGDSAATVTERLFDMLHVEAEHAGSIERGTYYLQAIKNADTHNYNIPTYITEHGGPSNEDNYGNDDDTLGEFDYSDMSGWMITVNHYMIPVGAAAYEVHPGDVIRWQYTLWGFGADLGVAACGEDGTLWGDPPYFTEANKSELLYDVAYINKNKPELKQTEQYQSAMAALLSSETTASDVETCDSALDTITYSQSNQEPPENTKELKSLPMTIEEAVNGVSQYMMDNVTNPVVASIGGEWAILQLARANQMTDGMKNVYLTNVKTTLDEKNGILHNKKYTEYSRVIIGLTACGVDASNFYGYDLTAPLSDYEATIWQGINGGIYALIAMDCGNYTFKDCTVPGKTQNSRVALISFILGKELANGGWALSGTDADPDITAMAIQALAPYYSSNTQVKESVDRALGVLSGLQKENGGYSSWGTVNSESIAQVICALCSLGIDPAKDQRFIKEDGSWLLSALFRFKADGIAKGIAFAHTETSVNQMATEQAGYALDAYYRLLSNQSGLYEMGDVAKAPISMVATLKPGEAALIVPEAVQNTVGYRFTSEVRVGSLEEGLRSIQLSINVSDYLKVVNVALGNNLSGGTLDWNLSNGMLRIVYGNFTDMNSTIKTNESFPYDLFKVTYEITTPIPMEGALTLSLASLEQYKSSEDVVSLTDVLGVVQIPIIDLGVAASVLYTGDGTDLIPANKMAVKIILTGFEDTNSQIGFTYNNNYYALYKSNDYSQDEVNVYLAVVDANITLEELNKISNYKIYSSDTLSTITFGDTNHDNKIDAVDALNEVGLWLRKSNTSVNSDVILTYNVTGDSKINVSDALAIVERFITSKQFAVTGR